MITHIAIYEWKKEVSENDINQALQKVKSLEHKVPGIIAIHCGANFSKWAKNYTHAIIVLTRTKQALEDYRNHPDHASIAKIIEQYEQDGIGIDFED